MTITGVTLQNANAGDLNFAQNTGGAIQNFEQLNLSESRIVNNTAYAGAGIENLGTVTSTNNTFAQNITNSNVGNGGGVSNLGGTFTSTRDTFYNNAAPNAFGGGIFNGGTFSLINGTVANNSAGGGGGIFKSRNIHHDQCHDRQEYGVKRSWHLSSIQFRDLEFQEHGRSRKHRG